MLSGFILGILLVVSIYVFKDKESDEYNPYDY